MYTGLSALTRFSFKSLSEYVDDLATQIYTPQLDRLFITFLNQLILNTAPLAVHQSHTEVPAQVPACY
jgi:hypothetical protein